MNTHKTLLYSIVLLPIALVVMALYFVQIHSVAQVTHYFEAKHKSVIDAYTDSKKSAALAWIQEQNTLFDTRYKNVEREIVQELQEKIYLAHGNATLIYKNNMGKKSEKEIKEQILLMLKKLSLHGTQNFIFINDYSANIVLETNKDKGAKHDSTYRDADARSIVLEEVQKARKYGEGFLKSRVEGAMQIIFVKDLGFYNWIFGTSVNIVSNAEYIKPKLLEILQKTSAEKNSFFALYENKKLLFSSAHQEQSTPENLLKYVGENLSQEPLWQSDGSGSFIYMPLYYAPLDWHVVYGFDMSGVDANTLQKLQELEQSARAELSFVAEVLLTTLAGTLVLCILWLIGVTKLARTSQTEVQIVLTQTRGLSRLHNLFFGMMRR